MKVSSLVHDIRLATYLVNNSSFCFVLFFCFLFCFVFSENITMLERKHHVCDLESTYTVKCLNKDTTDRGQNISWYSGGTGVKIRSGGRIELNGLSLKINNVHLDDAGTYECRGVSSTRFYTIYVNGEFSLCSCCSELRHGFRYTSPLIECNVFWYSIVLWLMLFLNVYYYIIVTKNLKIIVLLLLIIKVIIIFIYKILR